MLTNLRLNKLLNIHENRAVKTSLLMMEVIDQPVEFVMILIHRKIPLSLRVNVEDRLLIFMLNVSKNGLIQNLKTSRTAKIRIHMFTTPKSCSAKFVKKNCLKRS